MEELLRLICGPPFLLVYVNYVYIVCSRGTKPMNFEL